MKSFGGNWDLKQITQSNIPRAYRAPSSEVAKLSSPADRSEARHSISETLFSRTLEHRETERNSNRIFEFLT